MEQLQQVLTEILQTISDTLGYSVDTLKANGSQNLAEYGRYCLIGDIQKSLVIGLLIGIMIAISIFFMLCCVASDIVYKENTEENAKSMDRFMNKVLKLCIAVVIISIVISIGFVIAKYFASPEIYGLEHLIKMVK